MVRPSRIWTVAAMKAGWASDLVANLWSSGRRAADHASIQMGWGHVTGPTDLGDGPHDCALASLYWVVPRLSEDRIAEAFQYCTEEWPYGGVTNTEFATALRYLKVENRYFDMTETLGDLLARQPTRCVALLPYHFVAILKGRVVGNDAHRSWNPRTTVYCSWTFR